MKKTRAQLRIQISRDTLKHIEAKSIIVEKGHYLFNEKLSEFIGESLQECLPKLKECRVCALGALFYSYVERHNNYTIKQLEVGKHIMDLEMRPKLKLYFSNKQLGLIETAFERNAGYAFKAGCTTNNKWRAYYYRDHNGFSQFEQSDEVLTSIMKNIIKNKGTFKP